MSPLPPHWQAVGVLLVILLAVYAVFPVLKRGYDVLRRLLALFATGPSASVPPAFPVLGSSSVSCASVA